MELVKVQDGHITVAEEVMKKLHDFQVKKAEMDLQEKEIKQAMLKAMEDNDIKSFENDFVKITYKAPTTQKRVDTEALKEQDLYDMFLKETPVKSSVMLTWKK
mgnify:CR=1 FL=1|jgi:hypothetical protein